MQVDTEAERSAGARSETRIFVFIFSAFILSRLTLLTFNDAEFTDGYLYIQWSFDQLELRHPLYPLFIQVFTPVFDPVVAGRFVSSLAGLISLAILYSISLRLYGKTGAAITAALWTLSPMILWIHSRVLSESLFLMFFLAALLYFLRTLEEQRWEHLCLQIFFSGLATLTRPEGLAFAPLLLYSIFHWTQRGDRKSLRYTIPAFIPWALFGLWTLFSGLGYSKIMESSMEKTSVRDFITYFVVYLESYPYVMCYPVFALAFLGLFRSSTKERSRWLFMLGYFHLIWFLTISIHRSWSTRFLIVPLTLLLVEAAGTLDWLRVRLKFRSWSILTAVTLLSCGVLALTSLYFQKQIFADVKESALFVREHYNNHRIFSDEKTKVSYYSGNYVHVFQPNTAFNDGDILILNSFYTPLQREIESLSKRYNLALLHQSNAQTKPVLANINTETTNETHSPEKFVWRFQTQRFQSLVIGIASRKK